MHWREFWLALGENGAVEAAIFDGLFCVNAEQGQAGFYLINFFQYLQVGLANGLAFFLDLQFKLLGQHGTNLLYYALSCWDLLAGCPGEASKPHLEGGMREELRDKDIVNLILHANKINVGIMVQVSGEGIATNSSPLLSATNAAPARLLSSARGRVGGRDDGTAIHCDGLLKSVASCVLRSNGSSFILGERQPVDATPAICRARQAKVFGFH